MRAIDADAVKELIRSGVSVDTYADQDYVCELVDEIPTIDAVEVVRGEWIDKGWKGDWQFETDGRGTCWYEYECSECGFRNKGSKSNFCPNCGAKMKGADDE